MTLRCRPGDLAVVTHPAENTGLFVTVLDLGPPHPQTHDAAWHCKVAGPCKVTTVVTDRRGRIRTTFQHTLPAGESVLFRDRELQPIRPHKPPEAIPAPSRELEYTK